MKIFQRGRFVRFIDRFGDLTILNLLFLISCIPLITIPAAVTAMYACTLKLAGGEGFEGKWFWNSFRRDFKTSLQIGLLIGAAGILLFIDGHVLTRYFSGVHSIFRYILYVLAFLLLCTASFAFPLAAQFENTCVQHLKNGALLALRHFPKTLVVLALNFVPVALFLMDFEVFLRLVIFWLLFGFAAAAYANAILFRKIFQSLIPTPEPDEEQDE